VGTILFDDGELRVRHVPCGGRVCVVTFDSYNDVVTLDRAGFGENFFLGRGIDAIHVITARNGWYQHEGTRAALAVVREAVRSYTRVLTYGSSMGGYAAIRFAGHVNGDTAIALSPQYSIDPRRMPLENRWVEAQTIRFREELEQPIRGVRRTVVCYDPRSIDAVHVERIASECAIEQVRLPYAGHPATSYLVELGLLSALVDGLVEDRFDAAAFEREARAGRARSGKYFDTLALRLAHARPRASIQMCRHAVRCNPSDPAYRLTLAERLASVGEFEKAEQLQRIAWFEQPSQPLYAHRLSFILAQQGKYEEAIELANRAVELAPHSARWHVELAALREQAAREVRSTHAVTRVHRSFRVLWRALACKLGVIGSGPSS
jgi:tetratricopeptide (TPR) repeat protein